MKRICLLVVAAILTSCQWGAVAEYLPYLMMTSPKSVKLESSGLPQYKLEKDRICFTLEVTGQKISQYYATDPFNDWDYMLPIMESLRLIPLNKSVNGLCDAVFGDKQELSDDEIRALMDSVQFEQTNDLTKK